MLLADWLTDSNLALLNTDEPTYLSSTGVYTHIDLTISTPDIAPYFTWQPHSDSFESDHFPISIYTAPTTSATPPTRWKLKTADWPAFKQSIILPEIFSTPTQACADVTTVIIESAVTNIGLTKPHATKQLTSSWWTEECTQARKEKNRALNHYKCHRGDLTLWIEYKKARAKFRYSILTTKKNSWSQYLSSINSSTGSAEVWRKVRSLSHSCSRPAIVLKAGDTTISDPRQVANTLCQHFANRSDGSSTDVIFTDHKTAQEATPMAFLPDDHCWYNNPLTLQELQWALRTSTSKSPGPDTIPYSILQQIPADQQLQLLAFFNHIFSTGFPDQWREGLIVPILKPGKPATNVSSYRPIALTNCLSKLLEKMLNQRLQAFLEENVYYDPCQSGFRSSHSTLDALTRLETAAKECINEGRYCIAVFLDIERAFDTVWHRGILNKLGSLGLRGNLALIIQGFLQDRVIRVRLPSATSDQHPLYSGVPQGSVFSPTLFTIIINDLFAGMPDGIAHSLYADDGALWCCHEDLAEATNLMQSALNQIITWTHSWGLQVSTAKTYAMIFTRRRPNNMTPLLLDTTTISYVPKVRFLGVLFDGHLTWGPHISALRARCQKDLRLLQIIAAHRWGADYLSLKRLYLALIRPKLDYGSQLFDTAAPTTLLVLDRIQYAAIRTMLGALRCTPTNRLEAETGIMPLVHRRKLLLTKYAARCLSVPLHPVRKQIINHNTIYRHLPAGTRKCLPSTARVSTELQTLQLDPNTIPTIPMSHKYHHISLPIDISLAGKAKEELPAQSWQQLFQELINNFYPQHILIYCDGSQKEGNTGCGVWSSSFTLKARLPSDFTVYSSELYAIYISLSFLVKQPGSYLILSDSLSSLHAIRQPHATKHYLVSRILSIVTTLPRGKFTLAWVPSHMGIYGNERADEVAKSALQLQTITAAPLSYSDLCRVLSAHYRKRWLTAWQTQRVELLRIKPTPIDSTPQQLPRPQQVCITRIRLQTCLLTHGHYFSGDPRPICNTCSCALTLDHLLLHCTAQSIHRHPLQNECTSLGVPFTLVSLLHPTFPANLLWQFISAAGFAARI
jgi:ribonuclease HI